MASRRGEAVEERSRGPAGSDSGRRSGVRRPEDEAPITIPNLGLEGRVSIADELRCRSPSGGFNELPNSPRMNARTMAPNVRLTNSSCSVSALE